VPLAKACEKLCVELPPARVTDATRATCELKVPDPEKYAASEIKLGLVYEVRTNGEGSMLKVWDKAGPRTKGAPEVVLGLVVKVAAVPVRTITGGPLAVRVSRRYASGVEMLTLSSSSSVLVTVKEPASVPLSVNSTPVSVPNAVSNLFQTSDEPVVTPLKFCDW
jgi:hypothetical protein